MLPLGSIYAPPALPDLQKQQITVEPQGQPVTVAVNIQPQVTIKPKIEPHNLFQPENMIHTSHQGGGAIAQSKSSATNTTVNKIRLFLSQTLKQMKIISTHHVKQSAAQWCALHKKKIIWSGTITSYILIAGFLVKGTIFMHKETTWAAWKKQLSMEELLALSQDQLGKELVHAIEQRHVNIKNPTDHITPLVRFIQTVDQEMKILNQYLAIAKTVRRCRLMRIFPTNNQKIERAQELKQRLLFIKHTFISWAATDNLANFNH